MSRRALPRRPSPTLATLIAATLLMGACASPGPRTAPGARGEPGTPPPTARRGGYYLDDGPGSGPPPDIDAIADATPRAEPLLPRANRPYVVFDRQYTPMTALAPYRERGPGSWYGRKYHGQRTSSGEVYDMYAMTAAHPTLPIPSFARVTNLRNGRSVVVRVNDRGPFLHNRVIDLSYTAAAKLGYLAGGSAELEVELITRFDPPAADARAIVAPKAEPVAPSSTALTVETLVAGSSVAAAAPAASAVALPPARPERLELETVIAQPDAGPATSAQPASSPQPAPSAQPRAAVPAEGSHYLQLAAFATRENAESSRSRLSRELEWLADRLLVRQEGALFKVHAGPYRLRDEALAVADRIRQATAFKPFPVAR